MKQLLLMTALPLHAAVVHVEMPAPVREEDYFGMCRCAERREFDFDGNGVADLTFTGTGFDDQMISITSSRVYTLESTYPLPGVDVPPLTSGILIGVGTELAENNASLLYSWGEGGRMGWHRRYQIMVREYNRMAHWYSSNVVLGIGNDLTFSRWWRRREYLGFQFQDDNNQSHFGWMSLTYYEGTLEFHEWAYETEPNTPVRAGQVPEPGAAALCAAGLGLGLRRRRR